MKDAATRSAYIEHQLERLSQQGGVAEPTAILHAVARRNAFVIGATDLARPELDRIAAQEALTDVARDLHQLDAQEFVDAALSLDLSTWPDLEAWRIKLGVTLERRAAYAAANESPEVDATIFDPVWGLAICPARDAAQVEDLFFREVGDVAVRNSKRTVARLQRDHSFVAARHEEFLRRVVELAELQRRWRRSRRLRPLRLLLTLAILSGVAAFFMWLVG